MRILPPTPESIAEAAEALRNGALVGMPTETVYGIAAVATNEDAVRRTFEVKGRPADNPLIVHLADFRQLEMVAADVPLVALRLAERFWPGPLTLVLPKQPHVPDVTTGGLATVAVRIPAHPVALRLISAVGTPLSAPSANPFMGLSPTRAEHLDAALGDRLALVLDGGACTVGVESTVVDCTGEEPLILRPGGITTLDLEDALGQRVHRRQGGERSSPGMYARHYAPRTPIVLVDALGASDSGITLDSAAHEGQIALPRDPVAYAVSLYAALHQLDALGLPTIYVQRPPESPEWEAVWDRLSKAATTLP